MFGIRYLKVAPTTHVLQFRRGKLVRDGAGLSFFYFAPNSVLARVPVGSTGVPFVFNEVTADFQDATIQGEVTYRVTNPVQLAGLMDFSVTPDGRYVSDDPNRLSDRLVHATQILARAYTQKLPLRELLVSSDTLVQQVTAGLVSSETATMLGLEILGVTILSIKPIPEMAKALQTEAREQLLQEADEAVYARRNTAVELERKIKENELKTEIAIELKRREVRETKLTADVALEKGRQELVDLQVENQRKESAAHAEAIRALIEPIKDMDWRTLLASQSSGGLSAQQLIALAFGELAENADRLGTLNISPDLLQSLLDTPPAAGNRAQDEG